MPRFLWPWYLNHYIRGCGQGEIHQNLVSKYSLSLLRNTLNSPTSDTRQRPRLFLNLFLSLFSGALVLVSINGCETCTSLQISVASRSSLQRVVRSWCSPASYFTSSEGGLTLPLPSSCSSYEVLRGCPLFQRRFISRPQHSERCGNLIVILFRGRVSSSRISRPAVSGIILSDPEQ